MFKLLLISLMLPCVAMAQGTEQKTVVLIHGAFADGSSWDKVIPILQAKGLKVVAVQNPLTSPRLPMTLRQANAPSTGRAGL
jgi:hypothetical protein